jgi:hypothetical protein
MMKVPPGIQAIPVGVSSKELFVWARASFTLAGINAHTAQRIFATKYDRARGALKWENGLQ